MASKTLELNLTSTALIKSVNYQLEMHGTRCSFCGLGEGQVLRLFEGRSRYICNECILVCSDLLSDYKAIGYTPSWYRSPWYMRLFRGAPNGTICCSFCGAERVKGEYLMASSHSQICERCIHACESISRDSFHNVSEF